MNILMASILNIHSDMNGVTVSITELKDALARQGHDVGIVTPYMEKNNSYIYKLYRKSAALYHKYNSSIALLTALFLKMMIVCLQVNRLKNNYDVFHAHDVFSAAAILFIAGKDKIRLLSTHFHSSPWDEFALAGFIEVNSPAYKLLRLFSRYILTNKNLRKISVSEHNFRDLNRLLPGCALDKNILYPGLKIENGHNCMQDKAHYLINVGTVDKRKNQTLLIDILAQLEQIGLFIPLVIVGPEDETIKNQIQKKIKRLNIKSNVHFLGEQSTEHTRKLIAGAKLYIHTSLRESFGRTLIEAINLQTPTLAREYGAVNEIIDGDAVFGSHWTPIKMASHIHHLLTNKTALERLQKKQYKRFLNNFTEEKMINSYHRFLTKSKETSMEEKIYFLNSAPGTTKNVEQIDTLYNKYARGGYSFAQFKERAKSKMRTVFWFGALKVAKGTKRFLDILASVVFLILLTPLFLITAAAILIEDGRPIFYNQTRIAKWGKQFKMYKFRSMYNNADERKEELQSDIMTGGVIFKMKNDPRITRTGRIIRKFSIDELPQMWNVLKGDLSLVGPRPPIPQEVNEYSRWDRKRLEVKPGLTCTWQVSGRSDIDFENQVKLDIDYIRQQSLKFDFMLLLKTIPAVLTGKGAY